MRTRFTRDALNHATVDQRRRAGELLGILRDLEAQLADPRDIANVGRAYIRLSDWTRSRQTDEDLPQVLKLLSPETLYPPWRRQALEEAYLLFYDDCAKLGNGDILSTLCEPAFRTHEGPKVLPEAMLSAPVRFGTQPFEGSFDVGGQLCLHRKWEYAISKNTGSMDLAVSGRVIIRKQVSERYCMFAGGSLARLTQHLSAADMCCGRNTRKLPAPSITPR